ncbi:hypothetical protein KBB96_07840 [Luteolibacter ambystomatis]|uniref:Uncharacterized protein n=1 Tax=Luteolibacter ambystomatis TaxID=2824561 RepID=A0A975PGJ3_9BACT|nr:hypothetical protein [Luteolibacter ambystomatis]QUE52793.1 hypothetical protein KBB96_07840 [Luteolibacter ambystomatis]
MKFPAATSRLFFLILLVTILAHPLASRGRENNGIYPPEAYVQAAEKSHKILQDYWDQKDSKSFMEWFEAPELWKNTFAKSFFIEREYSRYKFEIAIMMLNSPASAWADKGSIVPSSDSAIPVLRMRTIASCTQAIKKFVPDFEVNPSDFETPKSRTQLASRLKPYLIKFEFHSLNLDSIGDDGSINKRSEAKRLVEISRNSEERSSSEKMFIFGSLAIGAIALLTFCYVRISEERR